VISSVAEREFGLVELLVSCPDGKGVAFRASLTAGALESLGLRAGGRVFLLIKARAFYLLA
ncbi:MAG: hypothetical protein ACRD9R_16010, partial [Pyrinomonadaceae bacterium]